jgi:hypothetical protein
MTEKKAKKPPLEPEVVKLTAQIEVPFPKHGDPRTAYAQMQSLRFSAGMRFVLDLDGMTIEALSNLPEYKHIGKGTIYQWAARDKWTERRSRLFEEVQGRLERRMSATLTEALAKRMEHLIDLQGLAYEKLMSKKTKTGSWESVGHFFLKIGEQLLDVQKTTVQNFAASITPEGGEPLPVELDEQELRDTARIILRQRREKLRERIAAEKKLGDGTP